MVEFLIHCMLKGYLIPYQHVNFPNNNLTLKKCNTNWTPKHQIKNDAVFKIVFKKIQGVKEGLNLVVRSM
jgi:hypothetical protein